MRAKYFWLVVVTVTGALEEALRNDLIPAEWLHIVAPASTLLGFLVQRLRPEA